MVDINKLLEYCKSGWVDVQSHPKYPNLQIFNYSRKTQYSNHWDEITLNSRGLIVDMDSQKIVATGFPKFFNIEEHNWEIPNEPFEIFEKEDGSLGICFYYDGKWHLATRGSFSSDQANEGKKILDENYGHLYPTVFDRNSCYLFEIIYPENRIVVNYGDTRDLILIGKYQIFPMIKELDVHNYANLSFSVVIRYNGHLHFKELKALNIPNSEGFVIRFRSGKRMKIKFEEYVKLHAIVTNISTVSIWEQLKSGKTNNEILDLIEVDEIYDSICEYIEFLRQEYQKLWEAHLNVVQEICYKLKIPVNELHDIPDFMEREFAMEVQKYPKPTPGIIFAYYRKNFKRMDNIIWTEIKPKYQKLV